MQEARGSNPRATIVRGPLATTSLGTEPWGVDSLLDVGEALTHCIDFYDARRY